MGINFRKKVLLQESILKTCEKCQKAFPEEADFCVHCGSKLSSKKTKVYANMGKNGITSITFKMPNGITINSKGNMTVPLDTGLSYTSKLK